MFMKKFVIFLVVFILLMIPSVSLKGDRVIVLDYPNEYKEPGFSVRSINKNVETKVKGNVNDEKLGVYKISYSAQNLIFKTTKTRTIKVKDLQKPEIDLFGGDEYLFLNEEYVEKGFKAYDNLDGDLTDKVKIKGEVNSKKSGVYYLDYSVSDKSLNYSNVSRKVIVSNSEKSAFGCGISSSIYLTFDDGPSNVTSEILDILKDENVKATFFVTSSFNDEIIKREYDEGHTVGLHTYGHDYSYVYSSEKNYFDDLNKVSNRVERIIGFSPKIIRFPGGSSNLVSKKYNEGIMTRLTEDVLIKGYKYFDWNVDSFDASICSISRSSACVYESVVNNLSKDKCNMILMHDTKEYTKNALRDIIKYGKDNGYEFKQIDNTTHMVKQRVNN